MKKNSQKRITERVGGDEGSIKTLRVIDLFSRVVLSITYFSHSDSGFEFYVKNKSDLELYLFACGFTALLVFVFVFACMFAGLLAFSLTSGFE